MSVWKPKGSPYYQFDFWYKGDRFYGSTKRKGKREAEQYERAERERVKLEAAATQFSSTSLVLDHVAGRYWNEVGQHHAGSDNTLRDLNRLILYFGPSKLLSEITDNDVASLIAWRRSHQVIRDPKKKTGPLISNATVNRSTLEPLKKLFGRAKSAWGAKFDHEPNWKVHRLPEAEERVRELSEGEAAQIELAVRVDYAPLLAFARATGLRLRECLLRWEEVDWAAGRIRKPGKGKKHVSTPITDEVRDILAPLVGQHPVMVFTYVAKRSRNGRVKGKRYPITYSGVKIMWRRLRARAGVADLRFHDLRHDLATKLLRQTGNIKLVQKALNHASLKTTTRYAHVLDEDVAAALERLNKSRNKSRSTSKDAI